MKDNEKIRVRIAPSPTGDPHVGLAYITLFNYVFAKKYHGELILRIEDTDQQRFSKDSEEKIIAALKWLGLRWDEGPDCGGPHAPYRQSQRLELYRKSIDLLVQKQKAYPCFCNAQRLEELRDKQKRDGIQPGYDRHCLSLSKAEIERLLETKTPHVIRLKTPKIGEIKFVDQLRGEISISAQQIDDQVLLKSDGFPTYHLANVVDDHDMKITHVIRAEEWISSTPKHVLLYEAFGWDAPQFIHMPILRNHDHSKISKRKNPVSLNYYKRKGILPKAMLNFLALMGWSFSSEQEIFTIKEMIEKFDFKQIHLGGPVFDMVKLTHINHQYMQKLSAQEFSEYIREEIFSKNYLEEIHPMVVSRLGAFEEFVDRFSFLFNGNLDLSSLPIIPKGKTNSDMITLIEGLLPQLETISWTIPEIESCLEKYREVVGFKAKDYFMPLRLVATGRKDSPPIAESLCAIGKEMLRFRLFAAIKFLRNEKDGGNHA